MKTYKIEVSGEEGYNFNVELSEQELRGVVKVLEKCNELGGYNDSFIIKDTESEEELLTWL